MKIYLILLCLFACSSSLSDKFEVYINHETTKSDLTEYIKKAKERGIEMKILYASYFQSGKIKTLQVKFNCDIGSTTATVSYPKGAKKKCIYFIRDFAPDAAIPMGVMDCPNQEDITN